MGRDTQGEARAAAELLRAWARDDIDGLLEALDGVEDPTEYLVDHLREQEGDARRIQEDIEDELRRLIRLVRGMAYLTRHAIDLVLDPPDEELGDREAVLGWILGVR